MAPHTETAGQVQGVHRLRLQLPKHRPAHGLQLLVQLLTELRGDGEGGRLPGFWEESGASDIPRCARAVCRLLSLEETLRRGAGRWRHLCPVLLPKACLGV